MKFTIRQKWLRTIAWLRRNFPARAKVYVRSVRNYEYQGEALFRDNLFTIWIRGEQSLNLRMDTLIHEWAHVLTWFGAETHQEDHSAEWGIAYAKIYRTFLEWNFGQEEKESDE